MARRRTLALVAAPFVAASLSFGDGAFFVSQAKLSPLKRFGTRGVISKVGSGAERIDDLRFVVVDGAGRIVLGGSHLLPGGEHWVPAVARLLPDGKPDATFGDDGAVVLGLMGTARALAVDGDGRPVLAMRPESHTAATPPELRVVRFTTGGAPDVSFSGDSIVLTDGPGAAVLAVSPVDSSILVATTLEDGGDGVARLHEYGARDVSYGDDGVARADGVRSIAIDALGRAVVASDAGVERLFQDGSRDESFGMGGFLAGPDGGGVAAQCVRVDSAGRIVALAFGVNGADYAVFRFLPSGDPDGLFCENGVVRVAVGVPGGAQARSFSLGVPRDADGPYALASGVSFEDGSEGLVLQSLDPLDPAAVKSIVKRRLRRPDGAARIEFPGAAVSNDGLVAYAAGALEPAAIFTVPWRPKPLVLAADLSRSKPVPMPSLGVEWKSGFSVSVFPAESLLDASLTVTNSGRGGAANAKLLLVLSEDTKLDTGDRVVAETTTGALRPGASRTLEFRDFELHVSAGAVRGRRLLAIVNPGNYLPELDPTDNVAVSEPVP